MCGGSSGTHTFCTPTNVQCTSALPEVLARAHDVRAGPPGIVPSHGLLRKYDHTLRLSKRQLVAHHDALTLSNNFQARKPLDHYAGGGWFHHRSLSRGQAWLPQPKVVKATSILSQEKPLVLGGFRHPFFQDVSCYSVHWSIYCLQSLPARCLTHKCRLLRQMCVIPINKSARRGVKTPTPKTTSRIGTLLTTTGRLLRDLFSSFPFTTNLAFVMSMRVFNKDRICPMSNGSHLKAKKGIPKNLSSQVLGEVWVNFLG